MFKFTSLIVAAVAVAVAASAAEGANVSVIPTYVSATDTSSTPLTAVQTATSTGGHTEVVYSSGKAGIYTINLSVLATGLAANEMFNGVGFDVVSSPGLTVAGSPSYTPASSPLWFSNGAVTIDNDFGTSHNDLKSIVANVGTGPAASGDPRLTFATSSPASLGTIQIAWNGTTTETLQLGDATGNIGSVQFNTANATTGVIGNGQFNSDIFNIIFEAPIAGDADLNGIVNGGDLGVLASNFGAGPGAVGGRTIGDFDNNGIVNGGDLGTLASNFGKSFKDILGTAPSLGAAPATAEAPEPASLAVLALGGLTLLNRRKKA